VSSRPSRSRPGAGVPAVPRWRRAAVRGSARARLHEEVKVGQRGLEGSASRSTLVSSPSTRRGDQAHSLTRWQSCCSRPRSLLYRARRAPGASILRAYTAPHSSRTAPHAARGRAAARPGAGSSRPARERQVPGQIEEVRGAPVAPGSRATRRSHPAIVRPPAARGRRSDLPRSSSPCARAPRSSPRTRAGRVPPAPAAALVRWHEPLATICAVTAVVTRWSGPSRQARGRVGSGPRA